MILGLVSSNDDYKQCRDVILVQQSLEMFGGIIMRFLIGFAKPQLYLIGLIQLKHLSSNMN